MSKQIFNALQEKDLNNINEAISILKDFIDNNPRDSWSVFELAKIYLEQGALSECGLLVDNALERCKDLYNVYAAKSLLLEASGNELQALELLRLGLSIDPSNINAAMHLISFLARHGSEQEIASECASFFETSGSSQGDKLMLHALPLISKLASSSIIKAEDPWQNAFSNEIVNAAIVMIVKNESDIIGSSINHHYNLGFRCFFILDNNSSDTTRERLNCLKRDLEDAMIVIIDDPIFAHLQGSKLTLTAQYAINYARLAGKAVDWIFPLDADEFLSSLEPLHSIISSIPAHAKLIALPLRNLSSHEVLVELDDEADIYELFSKTHDSNFEANHVIKCAFRFTQEAEIAEGNHYAFNLIENVEEIWIAGKYAVWLNHLPIRSIAQIKQKTLQGAQSMQGLPGGSHWKLRFESFKREGDVYFERCVRNFING